MEEELVSQNDNETLIKKLEEAIRREQYVKIQLLLFEGAKVEETSVVSQTAIHFMFYNNLVEFFEPSARCVDLLFSHIDNDINYTDKNGLSHFHIACMIGNKDLAAGFIDQGVDVNMRYLPVHDDDRKGFTSLHFAVEYAGIEMIKLILKHEADVESKDFLSRTALHIACRFPEFHSASVQYPNHHYDCWNYRTEKMRKFLPAICNIHLEMIELLIKYKSDVNAKDINGNTPFFYIFQHDYIEKSVNRLMHPMILNKEKALLISSEFKRLRMELTALLLNYGANVTLNNNKGEAALHLAVKALKFSRQPKNYQFMNFNDFQEVEMITLILKNGADIEIATDEGESPLQIAVSLLSAPVVELLLENGANVSSVGFHSGKNKLFIYLDFLPNLNAIENLFEIIKLLSDRGFDFMADDNLSILKFLICTDADLDLPESLNNCDVNYICKILNILHYGSANVITNCLKKIKKEYCIGECRSGNRDLMTQIDFYFNKLKIGNLYFDKDIENILAQALSVPRPTFSWTNYLFKEEIEIMKKEMWERSKSLYDILISHPWKIHVSIANGAYKQILEDKRFCEKFKMYYGVIESHIAKNLVRKYVLETVINFSRVFIERHLPEPCCRKIFNYLSNENLFNLYLSSII